MRVQAALFREKNTARPEREASRKGEVNKAYLEAILAGSPRPAGLHFSGKKCKKMKMNGATCNVRTMLDKDNDTQCYKFAHNQYLLPAARQVFLHLETPSIKALTPA